MNKKCNCLAEQRELRGGGGSGGEGVGHVLKVPYMLVSKCPYETQGPVQLISDN